MQPQILWVVRDNIRPAENHPQHDLVPTRPSSKSRHEHLQGSARLFAHRSAATKSIAGSWSLGESGASLSLHNADQADEKVHR